MQYFKNIKTLEELKKEYHGWAMQLHPDRGGSTEAMQQLNAEYEKIFDRVKKRHVNKDGEEYTKDSGEQADDFKNLVDELLRLNGIQIEIIGSFVWVTGDTKAHKEKLKELGLKWHRKKACWFLSPEGYRRFGDKEYSLEDIRGMYGVSYSEKVGQKFLILQ